MTDLNPLCDFPAVLTKVTTMIDGPRIYLDLQEQDTDTIAKLAKLRYGDRFLYVVIYDADEFQEAIKSAKQ